MLMLMSPLVLGTLIIITRQVTRGYAPHLSLSRTKIIRILKKESITKQFFIVDFYTHSLQTHRPRNNS